MRHPLLPTLLAFSALLMALCGAAQASPDRVALVIGNGAYRSAPPLPNPPNDAHDFAAALRGIGFDVIEGRDLTRADMEGAVRQFSRKLDQAKIALFFYAGHGLQVNGKNYLVPVDAKLERAGDLSFDTVEIGTVLGQMEAENRVNLVFLDACRDNPLSRSLARSLGTRSAAVGQGLASVQSGIGTMIAFATQPDNVALDGAGRNSPFTTGLIKHIATPGLDISTVMRRVRADVIAATHQKQVPWDHSSLTGDVILVPGAPPAPTAAPVVAALPPATAPGLSEKGAVTAAAECDRLAADPFSPDKPANVSGVVRKAIVGAAAIPACRAAINARPEVGRFYYQLARALRANFELDAIADVLKRGVDAGSKDAIAEIGYNAFFAGQMTEARQAFERAAAAGNPDGTYYLGYLYNVGKGAPQDFARAKTLYEKAAAAGHGTAMNNLGKLYELGQGVRVDPRQAREWIEKGVAAGDETAMANYGNYFERGYGGLARDLAQARHWYEKAAALGDADSKTALAKLRN